MLKGRKSGKWLQVAGGWLLVAGCWVLVAGWVPSGSYLRDRLLVDGFNSMNKTSSDRSLLSGSVLHPFYVSVTEINHNSKDKTLEISSKMFADDLEDILEKNYRTTLDITVEKDKVHFDKFIADYVSKHLTFVVDGKAVKMSYVGFEKEKESAYCYFQIDNVSSVKKININNSLLYDFNDTEINIMHVTVGGSRQSVQVKFPHSYVSLTW